MIIKRLTSEDKARWDAYVHAHPDGTFFHRAGWADVIHDATGHRTHYLYVEQNGEIRGLLPLTEIRSPFFGKSLIANAFCVYGGPIVDGPDVSEMLDQAAWKIAEEGGIPVLEYRNRKRTHADWAVKDSLYVTFRKSLHADNDANMKAIPRKQRAMVRKGIDRGLKSVVDKDVDRLFAVYAESVRNLGTPVFGKKLFSRIMQEYGAKECDIVTIEHDGQPVTSVMNFHYKGEVLPYFGGGTRAARGLAANDFMYWEVMRMAVEQRGATLFDFGRSKVGTGPYSFKKNWGFEPDPLEYEYKLAPGVAMPDLSPMNPKYRLMIAVWSKLPLFIANTVGPIIARDLG